MYKLLAIMTAALVAFGAIAEEAKDNTANMAERRELAEKFMAAMKVEEQLQGSFKMVRQFQAGMIEKSLKDKADIEKAKKVQDEMMKIVETETSWDKLKPIFVDTYASVYTADELKEFTKFFASPIGQAFVDKSPQAQKLMMQKFQSIMANISQRVKSEMEKRMQAEKKEGKPSCCNSEPESCCGANKKCDDNKKGNDKKCDDNKKDEAKNND